MAHQTSEFLEKQATPRSIGRLMDVEVSVVVLLSHRSYQMGSEQQSVTREQRIKLPTAETALIAC